MWYSGDLSIALYFSSYHSNWSLESAQMQSVSFKYIVCPQGPCSQTNSVLGCEAYGSRGVRLWV